VANDFLETLLVLQTIVSLSRMTTNVIDQKGDNLQSGHSKSGHTSILATALFLAKTQPTSATLVRLTKDFV
jgi:hypothetical protein